VRGWLAGFFYTASGDAPPEEIKLGDLVRGDRLEDAFAWPKELPAWLTDEDLDVYAADYERTGFASALNYYRAADATWHEMAPFRGARITVPACFVAGDRDLVVLMNQEIYDGFPAEVPDLRTNLLLPGCGHWTQQERPEQTSDAMLEFLASLAG
jgi:pimeloyl-ACP methyl ester carboxylesterase